MEFGYLISKFGGKRKVDALTEKYGVALVFEPTESQNFLIGSSREFVGFHTRINNEVIKCIANRADSLLSENGRYDGNSFLRWFTSVDRRSFTDYFTSGTYSKLFHCRWA